MPARVALGRQNVARPGVVTARTKRIADCGAELTGYKNAGHLLDPLVGKREAASGLPISISNLARLFARGVSDQAPSAFDVVKNDAKADVCSAAHAARSGNSSNPLSLASATKPGMRQCGIEFDERQLETVLGGAPKALATATVPPSALIKASTFCMPNVLRKP